MYPFKMNTKKVEQVAGEAFCKKNKQNKTKVDILMGD